MNLAVPFLVTAALIDRALAAIERMLTRWDDRYSPRPRAGAHRAEDHPPQDGYRPAHVTAGRELPQRPRGNASLKDEMRHVWRPYTDQTVTLARIEMAKDWATEDEPTGQLLSRQVVALLERERDDERHTCHDGDVTCVPCWRAER